MSVKQAQNIYTVSYQWVWGKWGHRPLWLWSGDLLFVRLGSDVRASSPGTLYTTILKLPWQRTEQERNPVSIAALRCKSRARGSRLNTALTLAVAMNSRKRPAIVWVAFGTESKAIEGRFTAASQNCHHQFLKQQDTMRPRELWATTTQYGSSRTARFTGQ